MANGHFTEPMGSISKADPSILLETLSPLGLEDNPPSYFFFLFHWSLAVLSQEKVLISALVLNFLISMCLRAQHLVLCLLSLVLCYLIQFCCLKYFPTDWQSPNVSPISSTDLSLELQTLNHLLLEICIRTANTHLNLLCPNWVRTWSLYQTVLPMSINGNNIFLVAQTQTSGSSWIALFTLVITFKSWANVVGALVRIYPESDHFTLFSNQHHCSPGLFQWLRSWSPAPTLFPLQSVLHTAARRRRLNCKSVSSLSKPYNGSPLCSAFKPCIGIHDPMWFGPSITSLILYPITLPLDHSTSAAQAALLFLGLARHSLASFLGHLLFSLFGNLLP